MDIIDDIMPDWIGEILGGSVQFPLVNIISAIGTYTIKSANEASINFSNTLTAVVNNLFFSYKEGYVGSLVLFHALVGLFAGIILVIITLKKGAQNLFNMAGNENYTPATELIMDVIKSSGLAIFFPWLTAFIMGALPIFGKFALADGYLAICSHLLGANTTVFGNFIPQDLTSTLNGGWDVWIGHILNPGWWIAGTIFNFMLLISLICFVLRLCKFQVEMLLMDVTSIVAAIDSATTKKEFYELWLQSYKALVIDFIFNCLIFGLFTHCIQILDKTQNPLTSPYFMLAIGSCACLMKGTTLSNKFKQGGLAAGGVSAVANVARTATTVARF